VWRCVAQTNKTAKTAPAAEQNNTTLNKSKKRNRHSAYIHNPLPRRAMAMALPFGDGSCKRRGLKKGEDA
jgi:hypothetical protein